MRKRQAKKIYYQYRRTGNCPWRLKTIYLAILWRISHVIRRGKVIGRAHMAENTW